MPKYKDFATESVIQKEIHYYTQRFVLQPKALLDLSLSVPLTWQNIRLNAKNAASVVEKTGVYALVIRHDGPGLPPHGYVAYIGQAGADRPTRTLRTRFKEYVGNEKKRPKRPRVWSLLNKWEECLFFYFAPVDRNATDLKLIEAKLNDAMMPPYSRNDFSVDVRPRKNIWEGA
jgi:hypothetical protein